MMPRDLKNMLLSVLLLSLTATTAQAEVVIGPGGYHQFNGGTINYFVNNYGTVDSYGSISVRGDSWNCFWGDCANVYNQPQGLWRNYGVLDFFYSSQYVLGYGYVRTGELSNAGTFVNEGTLTNGRDTVLYNSNDLSNYGTLDNFGMLNNDGSLNNFHGTFTNHDGATLTNFGVVDNYSGATLKNDEGATLNSSDVLINHGILVNSGTLYSTGTLYTNGTLRNEGTLEFRNDLTNADKLLNWGVLLSTGVLSNRSSGTLTNFGLLQNTYYLDNQGTLTTIGNLVNEYAARLNIEYGATLTNYGTLVNLYELDNFGTLTNKSGATLRNALYLADYGTLENSGTLTNATSVLGSRLEIFRNGLLNNSGTFTNEDTVSNAGTLTNSGFLYNIGILTNSGTLANSGNVENVGLIDNSGLLTDSGMLNNVGNLLNSRWVWIDASGGFLNTGTYTQSAGATQVDGYFSSTTTIQINGGMLFGSGSIQGNVAMGGILSPGDSPGRLFLQGDYTQLAAGIFYAELAGRAPGTEYDQLVITGVAMLDGTLDVVLLDGFTVQVGDEFYLMTFATETGQFSDVRLPVLPDGEKWVLYYDPTDLRLEVQATPEPGTLVLLGSGLAAILGIARRRVPHPCRPSVGRQGGSRRSHLHPQG